MSIRPFIGLAALGPVDPEILRRMRAAIPKLLSLPVRILRPRPLPPQSYHVVRNQYHSTELLEYLLGEMNGGVYRILGITAVDLYIPILTFVFGEAQLGGQAAIISIYRPRGDADGISPPRSVFFRRLISLSLHELGHTFSLPHCRQEGCLMGFSTNLAKLDEKRMEFCPYCRVLLNDHFREQGLLKQPRLIRRSVGTPAPGVPIPAADSGRRRRR